MNLDEFKYRKKLTNKQLAQGLHCSETYVIFLRQGKNKPSEKMMYRIIEFTEGLVRPNDIYENCSFFNNPTHP